MNYFNKDLHDIGFKLIKPCDELKPYIQSFWIAKFKKLPFSLPLKIIADGNSGFVINFSSEYTIKINEKEYTCSDKFTYFPPSKHYALAKVKGDADVIGVRFNAAGVYKFFDKNISSFQEDMYPITNTQNWQIDKLYTQLKEQNKIESKIHIIELFLLNKLKISKKENSPWIFDFVNEIKKEKGNVNIEELCQNFKLNYRQVQRRFKMELGLSAKLYARIVRVQDTKKTLSSLIVNSLTKLSYDKGYFDQSHFINEFKNFIKETPKEYLNKKLTMAKKFSFKKYKE